MTNHLLVFWIKIQRMREKSVCDLRKRLFVGAYINNTEIIIKYPRFNYIDFLYRKPDNFM